MWLFAKRLFAKRLARGRLLLFAAVAVGAAGCTTSAREVREARTSGYMTDFAVVYSAALAATKELYPQINESATRQLIATAWHPLNLTTGTVTDSQSDLNANSVNRNSSVGSTGNLRTRYFIRFRIYVLGGKPFRVRIEGEASEWTEGEVPSPLKGAEVPPWLGARTDSLRVAIHRRLKEHAVPLETVKPKSKTPKGAPLPDKTAFGPVPDAAGQAIARVSQAADGRDFDALRKLLAADLIWARGSRGVDSALAIWAADNTQLTALSAALGGGCAEAGAEVLCPKEAAAGDYAGFVARFRVVEGAWVMTSFFQE